MSADRTGAELSPRRSPATSTTSCRQVAAQTEQAVAASNRAIDVGETTAPRAQRDQHPRRASHRLVLCAAADHRAGGQDHRRCGGLRRSALRPGEPRERPEPNRRARRPRPHLHPDGGRRYRPAPTRSTGWSPNAPASSTRRMRCSRTRTSGWTPSSPSRERSRRRCCRSAPGEPALHRQGDDGARPRDGRRLLRFLLRRRESGRPGHRRRLGQGRAGGVLHGDLAHHPPGQRPRAPLAGACLADTNDLLCQQNPLDLFVTAFYGILDLDTGELSYANAGHNPPLLARTDGTVSHLPGTGGVAMGVMPGLTYAEDRVTLPPATRSSSIPTASRRRWTATGANSPRRG